MAKAIIVITVAIAFIVGILYAKGTFAPHPSDKELADFGHEVGTIRGAIQTYWQQHRHRYPDLRTDGWKQLMQDTMEDGAFAPPHTAGMMIFPAYLRSEPYNPLTKSSAIYILSSNPAANFKCPSGYGFIYVEQASDNSFYALNADGTLFDDLKATGWVPR